jgi:hypothetical protein
LWDWLFDDPEAVAELDATDVTVEQLHRSGLSWWTNGGSRSLGPRLVTKARFRPAGGA